MTGGGREGKKPNISKKNKKEKKRKEKRSTEEDF